MTNANHTALGTVTRYDLSAQYAPGSYEIRACFSMFGLNFEAQRFVRTDTKCDNVDLFIRHDSQWFTDYVKRVNVACPADRVDARALHLLNLAACEIHPDTAARFAAIELF